MGFIRKLGKNYYYRIKRVFRHPMYYVLNITIGLLIFLIIVCLFQLIYG